VWNISKENGVFTIHQGLSKEASVRESTKWHQCRRKVETAWLLHSVSVAILKQVVTVSMSNLRVSSQQSAGQSLLTYSVKERGKWKLPDRFF
jgi:hypothetical protein